MRYWHYNLFLLLYSLISVPLAAQEKDCLKDYTVILELRSDTGTFDIWDVYDSGGQVDKHTVVYPE